MGAGPVGGLAGLAFRGPGTEKRCQVPAPAGLAWSGERIDDLARLPEIRYLDLSEALEKCRMLLCLLTRGAPRARVRL